MTIHDINEPNLTRCQTGFVLRIPLGSSDLHDLSPFFPEKRFTLSLYLWQLAFFSTKLQKFAPKKSTDFDVSS